MTVIRDQCVRRQECPPLHSLARCTGCTPRYLRSFLVLTTIRDELSRPTGAGGGSGGGSSRCRRHSPYRRARRVRAPHQKRAAGYTASHGPRTIGPSKNTDKHYRTVTLSCTSSWVIHSQKDSFPSHNSPSPPPPSLLIATSFSPPEHILLHSYSISRRGRAGA